MQRFKKFTMSNGNADAHGQPVVFGRKYGFALAHKAANRFGKFAYGANGTLTQAARWRKQAMNDIGLIRGGYQTAELIGEIRSLLDSARRGGARLPQ
jgi:hypothetical protein